MTRPLLLAALACAHAPAPAPSHLSAAVSLGTPTVTNAADEDHIDLNLVQAEIERNLGDLEACYGRALADNPQLSGEVEIHWEISTEGRHTHGCISEDTVADRAVIECVNQLVSQGAYPAAVGRPVDVTFPFRFTPAG